MIQLQLSYKTTIIGLSEYLDNSNDWMLQLASIHENSNELHSVLKESAQFSRQLNLDMNNRNINKLAPTKSLWDFSVQTNRTIQANRLDIIVKDKTNNTCLLIDMSVPLDKNVLQKCLRNSPNIKTWRLKLERCGTSKQRPFH